MGNNNKADIHFQDHKDLEIWKQGNENLVRFNEPKEWNEGSSFKRSHRKCLQQS